MPCTFVVDRNRPDLFRYLRTHFAGEPDIEVITDRRQGERRRWESSGPADRRRSDRRSVPTYTWATLGYVTIPMLARAASEPVPA
jgi:hypothetical protein